MPEAFHSVRSPVRLSHSEANRSSEPGRAEQCLRPIRLPALQGLVVPDAHLASEKSIAYQLFADRDRPSHREVPPPAYEVLPCQEWHPGIPVYKPPPPKSTPECEENFALQANDRDQRL